MALCESQLELGLSVKCEEDQPLAMENRHTNDVTHGNDVVTPIPHLPVPLAVDYRSPRAHFVPPEVEMYSMARRTADSGSNTSLSTVESNVSGVPAKRRRGRPRVDKTTPEYMAKSAAKKQAREMAVMINSSGEGERRKRGRPRIDKTSPEYLARKKAREIEALEKKAKKQYKRRTTGDSLGSSTEGTPRVKRKYTKRTPSSSDAGNTDGPKKRGRKKKTLIGPDGQPMTPPPTEKAKGKRGRPRKVDMMEDGYLTPSATPKKMQPKIRVRSNLMPVNTEPIPVDSDDEPDLGSPSQASDSLSLDENLRALRHLHEKYANIGKDDMYEAHLLAANFKQTPQVNDQDEVVSLRSSPGREDDGERTHRSSSSGPSGSSSSSSSSSNSSSSSSDSSDSDSEPNDAPDNQRADSRSSGSIRNEDNRSVDRESDSSLSEGVVEQRPPGERVERGDSLSESENESPDKSYQCQVCRKWYSTIVTLKIHRRVHLNRGGGGNRTRTRSKEHYECDCCDKVFSRREKLWDHKASAHRGSMTVRCDVCNKCFEDDAELAAHAKGHTDDERKGRCTECGSSFSCYEQLARHLQHRHAPRHAHACHQCGKVFGHAHSLTRHLHNHAKQLFRCVVCKMSFARADQLAQHLNSHLANYKRLKN